MDQARIIRAGREHLDDIVRLEKIIFPKEPFTRGSYRYLLKSPNAAIFLCVLGGETIGQGTALANRLRNGKSKGRIYSIGVLEPFRRKGYAAMLLNAMEEYLEERTVAFITLETHRRHESSVSFYVKHGYVKTGDLPEYYIDGDGIRMRKEC